MALYRYVKATTEFSVSSAASSSLTLSRPSQVSRLIPLSLMAIGGLLIVSVVSPIVYHLVVLSPSLSRAQILSPLPTSIDESRSLIQVAGTTTALPNPVEPATIPTHLDYTKASSWFPAAPTTNPKPSKITHYTIDIPKLNIKNAVVAIGGDDLTHNLIQYAETSNPGEFGTPVIFGHSILRQFYNPSETNPQRYVSIFSTIMTLQPGDKIFVNFDGIEYTYEVADKYEVKPEQIEVLQQRYDRRALKLVTCTPEGTYLRRGIVEAQLIQTS